MSGRDRYFDEWDEHSPIDWWNEGRRKLNVVIRLVNQWTIGGCDQRGDQATVILRHIEMGLATYGKRDGGSDWARALREMRAYVKERLED